jgi:hypothetical protein
MRRPATVGLSGLVALASIVLPGHRASAQPRPGLPARPDAEQRVDARTAARAPLPEQASGIARGEPDSASTRWRVVPRVLLFLPRVALEVVDAPIRGALWTYDRFSLRERARDVFLNEDGSAGLYPVFAINTDYGVTGGARFVHRDIFGEHERLSLRASYGGLYNQQYTAGLSTGDRLGARFGVDGEAEYEIAPRERFFGIGNGDEVEMLPAPIDPYDDPSAIDSRFRQHVGRVFGRARLKVVGPLSARFTSGALWKRFSRSSPGDIPEGNDIAEHYLTDEIPGFDQGAAYSYNELELRYDSRSSSTTWEPSALPSTGWLIVGYGGIARSFDRGPTHYARYGGDVQRYLRIAEGPRVIVLRALAEEVRGENDEIPFVDLPRLGGPRYLRGYALNRFRDRAIALASAEYQFDLGPNFAGYLFTDAGRVYPTFADLTTDDLRVGYGGGIQMHGQRSYYGRLIVASSIDGGIFFSLSFDPVYDPQVRLERD